MHGVDEGFMGGQCVSSQTYSIAPMSNMGSACNENEAATWIACADTNAHLP